MTLILPDTVNNPTASQPLPAAWGDAVDDAIAYVGRDRPRCRVTQAGVSIASSASASALAFSAETFDIGGLHSTSVNTSRVTFADAGYYEVGAGIKWQVLAQGARECWLRVNGTTTILGSESIHPAGQPTAHGIPTCEYLFAAADYVELMIRQDSTSTISCAGALWARWTGRT